MSLAARQPWDEQRVVAGQRSELRITASDVAEARVLNIEGLLDETTYIPLRDAIVRAALDEPLAVIGDVNDLTVRDDPAWAVFTIARWQVAEWPDVPILVVCVHQQGQNALRRNGITRYVPVYPTLQSAINQLPADGLRRYRKRVRAALPATENSIHRCRELTTEWLTAWSRADYIHAVSIVATEIVEMAVADADGELALRLETDGSTVSVAVQYTGRTTPTRYASDDKVSGLDLVETNCRVWGTYTSQAGNTVWAVVGPENRF